VACHPFSGTASVVEIDFWERIVEVSETLLLEEWLMKTAAFALASLLLSGAAMADTGTKAKGDKLICQKQNTTGSRLGSTRVCMTKEQWADHKREIRQDVERRQTTQTNPSDD
jgi:hypothetical protein